MLTFRILGAIEINTPTRTVRFKGALQSVLLVTLLVNARRLVLTEALIDEMWGPQPPHRVENALQAHMSRLRRRLASLEPDATKPRLIA
ncbi:MAG: AfsR/SARP family transcriptional regulator, partial [Pseudomonas sp.]